MALIRWSPRRTWDPFDWMRDFQREMNTAFDRSVAPWAERTPNGGVYVPSLDVSESENEVTVRADLPGLDKDDIDVSLVGNTLTIKGERKDESEEKKEGYYRRERTYGAFERMVELPENVDPGKPKASFKNGVLEIRLSKKETVKPKQIAIDVKQALTRIVFREGRRAAPRRTPNGHRSGGLSYCAPRGERSRGTGSCGLWYSPRRFRGPGPGKRGCLPGTLQGRRHRAPGPVVGSLCPREDPYPQVLLIHAVG